MNCYSNLSLESLDREPIPTILINPITRFRYNYEQSTIKYFPKIGLIRRLTQF